MKNKICFKCNTLKPLSEYYKHKQTGDGHLGKCKSCTKNDTKERHNKLLLNPNWVEKEQQRHRQKYYRLGYKDKHKRSKEESIKSTRKFIQQYPEKRVAHIRSKRMKKTNPINEFHHWSYNKEHYKDVIEMSKKHHAKAHMFIIYDHERMMYRNSKTNELLDTKERHLQWITYCIENFED